MVVGMAGSWCMHTSYVYEKGHDATKLSRRCPLYSDSEIIMHVDAACFLGVSDPQYGPTFDFELANVEEGKAGGSAAGGAGRGAGPEGSLS